MTIFSFFSDDKIKRFLPDVKRIHSGRTNCGHVLLYSEEIRQIIYIRQSERKQNLNKVFMRQYQERNIRNMRRLMLMDFGTKRGKKLFAQSDKLDVLIVQKASKLIWRYLWALNKREDSATYNKKTYHMVFEEKTKTEKQMASVIYGAVYRRLEKHLEKIETTLKEKTKLPNGHAYGELKARVDFMKDARDRMHQYHYKLIGIERLYDGGEMNVIVHYLGKMQKAKTLKEK